MENETNQDLIVLLQGPVGPFFSELSRSLIQRGKRVIKINLNLGDSLYLGEIPHILYSGDFGHWHIWFKQFLSRQTPAKVILFGDQRPYHQVAVSLCRELDIDVWCLEEGYIRPNYITAERNGNNAASLLPRDLFSYDATLPSPARPTEIQQNSFGPMALWAVHYYLAMKLGRIACPRYLHHRDRSILTEALLWTRNAACKYSNLRGNAKKILDLVANFDHNYFIVALQVHDDLQLRVHGSGWTMEGLIDSTISSFATFGPPAARLVFKVHPLDRGHRSYRKFVSKQASLAGVNNRVCLIEDGPMGLLLRHARGLVTVNSTAGLLALQRDCAVMVLGEALYAIDGLVTHGDERQLHGFWTAPFLPKLSTRDAFLHRLIDQTQINGSYYLPRYFDLTIKNLLEKIDRSVSFSPQIHSMKAT